MADPYAENPKLAIGNEAPDNAGKLDWGDPNVPIWQKMGFGDGPEAEAAYNNVYNPNRPTSPQYVQPNASGSPTFSSGPAPGDPDPFGTYLKNNPGVHDAWAYLENLLSEYGLGSLTSFTKNSIIQGYSQNEVVQQLRETPEYKTRFKAIEQRKDAGLSPLSEADVVNAEKSYEQVLKSAGLPPGFYDNPDDYTNFLVSDVSPDELQQRVVKGYQAAMNAPPETRSALQNLYGIGPGELAAYYLDPGRTEDLLQRQLTAAQMAGTAQTTGYGALNRSQAERLTALGIDPNQAATGFGQLAKERELFSALPGEADNQINQDQQLAAAFGNDANQQQRIKKAADQRVAEFGGSTQYATNKTGYTGLGTAR